MWPPSLTLLLTLAVLLLGLGVALLGGAVLILHRRVRRNQERLQELNRLIQINARILDQVRSNHEASVQQLRQLVQTNKSAVRRLRRQNKRLQWSVERLAGEAQEVGRRVDQERRQRVLSFARRDANGPPPQRWLLIVGPQRTGSTWLFDALRCHPAIQFFPVADVMRRLGVGGSNRYPRDLSDAADATVDIELSDGTGAQVPGFRPPESLRRLFEGAERVSYAMEKLHPEFFQWDAQTFASLLDRIERENGTAVTLIYRLRDPEATMRSMLLYKRRQPTWYAHVSEDEIGAFVLRSYETVDELARLRPGLISDYDEHAGAPSESLQRLFAALWPGAVGEEAPERALVAWAVEATDREIRRQRQSGDAFLADRVAGATGSGEPIDAIIARHRDELDRCQAIYQQLMQGTVVR